MTTQKMYRIVFIQIHLNKCKNIDFHVVAKHRPEVQKKQDFKGLSTCPNKSNIYHECNYWCETHWKGVATPDPKYVRNIQKLLGKYPLPMNWTEIFDKGV